VAASYINAVADVGVRPRIISRWLNAVSVDLDAARADAQLRRLAALPFVTRISPVALRAQGRPTHEPPTPAPEGFYGRSEEQLDQINLIPIHLAGHAVAALMRSRVSCHSIMTDPGSQWGVRRRRLAFARDLLDR
jgi:hypothetical protein